MRLINENITYARLLVKLAVIRRPQMVHDFSENWALGSKDDKDAVNKVVDVYNKAFEILEEGDELSTSLMDDYDLKSDTVYLDDSDKVKSVVTVIPTANIDCRITNTSPSKTALSTTSSNPTTPSESTSVPSSSGKMTSSSIKSTSFISRSKAQLTKSEARELFDNFDKNKDGSISKIEMINAARDTHSAEGRYLHKVLGLPDHVYQEDGTKDMLVRLFDSIDVDNSNSISFHEFVTYIDRVLQLLPEQACEQATDDGNGDDAINHSRTASDDDSGDNNDDNRVKDAADVDTAFSIIATPIIDRVRTQMSTPSSADSINTGNMSIMPSSPYLNVDASVLPAVVDQYMADESEKNDDNLNNSSLNLSSSVLQNILNMLPSGFQHTLGLSDNQDDVTKSLLIGLGLGVAINTPVNSSTVDTAVAINSHHTVPEVEVDVTCMNTSASSSPSRRKVTKKFNKKHVSYLEVPYSSRVVDVKESKFYSSSSSELIDRLIGNNVVLELKGLSDADSKESIENNINDILDDSQRLVALDISHSQVECMHSLMGNVFADEDNDLKIMLCAETLKYCSIHHTLLHTVDGNINQFNQLLSLDLSSNQIAMITEPLVLPMLVTLNLSNNRLKSLDFLQQLTALQVLDASVNCLASLHLSVHILVTIAGTIVSLDMSRNAVCNDAHYIEDVIQMFPSLQHFDTNNLGNYLMHEMKRSTSSSRTGSGSRGVSNAPPSLPHEMDSTFSNPLEGRRGRSKELALQYRIRRAVIKKKNDEMHRSMAVNNTSTIPTQPQYKEYKVNYTSFSGSSPGPSVMNNSTSYGLSNASIYHQQSMSIDTPSNTRATTAPVNTANTTDTIASSRAFTPTNTTHGTRSASAPRSRSSSINSSYKHATISNASNSSGLYQSNLLKPTQSEQNRRKSFGIGTSIDVTSSSPATSLHVTNSHKVYSIESDVSYSNQRSSIDSSSRRSQYDKRGDHNNSSRKTSKELLEMQVNERYSKWHPRYSVPKPIFGFSKPFAHRNEPEKPPKPPLFDTAVARMRDSFELLPQGGTFDRQRKSLPPSFYPMDWDDIEAIRRQGYFHEVIGDIPKHSYQDPRNRDTTTIVKETDDGKIYISPTGTSNSNSKRSVIANHRSRQYNTYPVMNTKFVRPPDEYTGYRKYHPELYERDGYLTKNADEISFDMKEYTKNHTTGNSSSNNKSVSGSSIYYQHHISMEASASPPQQHAEGGEMDEKVDDNPDYSDDNAGDDEYMKWLQTQQQKAFQ